MVENRVIDAKKELAERPPEYTQKQNFLKGQIDFYESELRIFKEDIDKQLSEKFQFSIEELYTIYGQNDNNQITNEFHKFTESAVKFGRSICGLVTYHRRVRDELERTIAEGNVLRSKGMVKIDCSNGDKLNAEQKRI